jgi:hypothetical protein
MRKMRFALFFPGTTTIHGSFSHVAQVLKNGVVAKGLSWHLFGFPCEEIGSSIPKRLRVWLTPSPFVSGDPTAERGRPADWPAL